MAVRMQTTDSARFAPEDFSESWFRVSESGKLEYTPLGRSVYAPLFSKIGLSIDGIETLIEHKAALRDVIEVMKQKK